MKIEIVIIGLLIAAGFFGWAGADIIMKQSHEIQNLIIALLGFILVILGVILTYIGIIGKL